ncbi:hypothetical protein PC118_g4728 [Phytophthora cactorum]|uniref:Carrier domain-containing protein n=1 Tax=Phytophthora cactorum TaxID=29920 RepID=A0A8T1GE59_9STRA|nr:hypothetical protein PC118_g4728 [Phytophthora cactorum]
MALCQCLHEFWSTYGESEEVALVQSVGTERKEVTYVELHQWQKEMRKALNGGKEWLVVGINLTPFSIEETTTMLLVAQEKEWSYVTIDVELPVTRQLSVLQSVGARRLVTTAESPLAKYLVTDFPDNYFQDSKLECTRRRREGESFVAPLYVLFTSGTIGEPRGVMGTRIGAWTRLEWMWTTYPFDIKSERVLRATKLSFVDSVWEILGAFLKRVPLIHLQTPRYPEAEWRNMKSVVLDNSVLFLEVIRSEKATRFTAVPSVLEVLLLQTTEKNRKSALSGLRYVLSSGESLQLHVLQQLTTHLPDVTILNLYGSTEVSGDITCMELKAPFSAAQIAQWQQYGISIANLDRYGVLLEEILGISLSECISEDIRARTFADLGGNSLLATLFLHELRQSFGALCIAGQDLLDMTIEEVLWIVDAGSKSTKYRLQEPTTEVLQRSVKAITRTTEEPSDGTKRRKKNHHAHVSTDKKADAGRDDRSQQGKLSFVSRYNQSSVGVNGIYLPTSYVSPELPAKSTVPVPSLRSWGLRSAWRVDLSKCIDASPLVVQRRDHTGAVFSTWAIVGSHSGQLVCVDALAAGQEIWRVSLDDRIEASAALSLKHEIVYIGTYRGTLFALDLQTGETRWKFQAKGTIKASVIVMEQQELVVFGAYDNNFYGLDVLAGQLQWILDLQGSSFSTPLYCNWSKQLFVASTNGNVVAIKSASSGDFSSIKEHWRLQLPDPVFAGLNADFELNLLLVGCADGKLYGVNMVSGRIQWQLATEKPIFSSPCVYKPESVVFGSHDGMLRKVNSRTGELVWATNLNGAVFASPTVVRLVADGTSEEDGDVVCCVTTTTGQLCFCDERTGSILYQTGDSSGKERSDANSTENNGDLGPLFGSPVVVDNFCLFGTRTNYFYGFEIVSTTP